MLWEKSLGFEASEVDSRRNLGVRNLASIFLENKSGVRNLGRRFVENLSGAPSLVCRLLGKKPGGRNLVSRFLENMSSALSVKQGGQNDDWSPQPHYEA